MRDRLIFGTRTMVALALVGALLAIIFVGKQTVSLAPQTAITRADSSANSPPISPREMMMRPGQDLPTEHWRDPF
jgi:hypothetical protein